MNGPLHNQTSSPPTSPTSAPHPLPVDLLDAAEATLTDHREDDAFCQGCHRHYGQLKPYPCQQAL